MNFHNIFIIQKNKKDKKRPKKTKKDQKRQKKTKKRHKEFL